jgi:hypothetical protein
VTFRFAWDDVQGFAHTVLPFQPRPFGKAGVTRCDIVLNQETQKRF